MKNLVNVINYERINFFRDFKNNGYVKKILCLYKEPNINPDVVYFNDRERTEIPCIDKEVFIISNYDYKEKVDSYTLVQVDFSKPNKYEIIMQRNSKESNPKNEIYNHLRENNLVEIKDKPAFKKPQIDFNYGSIVIEIIENLEILIKEIKRYREKDLFNLILENVESSKLYIDNSIDKETMTIRFKNRLMKYLDIIYGTSDELTISEALFNAKNYQENYLYNV